MAEAIKFGTDGWRAVIADQFTFENVERVAYAIGLYLQQEVSELDRKPVLIGYDTRFMADRFALRAAQVLMAMGLKVKVSDRDIPTPCIAWAGQAEPTAGALQFTASHNPPEYCGVKYIPPYGGPATNDITEKIVANLKHVPPERRKEVVKLSRQEADRFSAHEPYLVALSKLIDLAAIKKAGLKVAYDALYSTSRGYLDVMLQKAGVDFTVLHGYRDPLFGGGMPEPTEKYLSELKAVMAQGDFDLGLATDGDADRFAVVGAGGKFFTPNQLLCLLTRHLHKRHGLQGAVVRNVATSHMLDHVAKLFALPLIETPVGFKYIGEKMRTDDVLIGGEESGGVSIKGHIPEKDGILANLLVLEMLALEGKSLEAVWQDLADEAGVTFFQRRGDLHLTDATQKLLLKRLEENPIKELGGKPLQRVSKLDGLKLYYDDDNWLLIRASGTEPVIRVSGEGTSEQLIDSLMLDFKAQIDEILEGAKAVGV